MHFALMAAVRAPVIRGGKNTGLEHSYSPPGDRCMLGRGKGRLEDGVEGYNERWRDGEEALKGFPPP